MRWRLFLLLAAAVVVAGCGSDGASSGLAISPSSVTLSRGESQTFTIVGADILAAVDPAHVEWNCTAIPAYP